MAFTYDINTSKKDTRSTVCLSACHLIFTVINMFLSTFLVAHIYSLTTDIFSYAINVGIYQISTYAVMLVSYYLFSLWVDKSNRIWCYRVANVISTSLVIVTIFYGKDLARLVGLAGVLNGLSYAAYYASYNVLKQEMVSRKSIGKFVMILEVLAKAVNVIFPVLLGMLIDVSSFSSVAIYVLVLCVGLIITTFFIKSQRPADSGFHVVEYFKRLKQNKELYPKMKHIYITCFFFGLLSVITSLVNINIMMQLGSNLSLGAITSVCAVISAVCMILVGKFLKAGKRSWMFILSSCLLVVASLIFLLFPSIYTVIAYNVCMAIGDGVVRMNFEVYRNKNLKEAGFYQDIAEHQCVVETIFNTVRCLGFGLLIVLGCVGNYTLFQVGFVVVVSLYSVTGISLMLYEKKFGSKQKDKTKEETIEENKQIENEKAQ